MALSQRVKDLILGLFGGEPDNQSEIVDNLNLASTSAQQTLNNLENVDINTTLKTADKSSGNTNNLELSTGNATSGNSGNIILNNGNASGNIGSINFSTNNSLQFKLSNNNITNTEWDGGTPGAGNGPGLLIESNNIPATTNWFMIGSTDTSDGITVPAQVGISGGSDISTGGAFSGQGASISLNSGGIHDPTNTSGGPGSIGISTGRNLGSSGQTGAIVIRCDNSDPNQGFAQGVIALKPGINVDMGGKPITNMEDPPDAQSAATKNYIDTRVSTWKNDLTFTFSSGFGTIAASDVRYRRIGDTMEVRGFVTSGTVAATVMYVQLPASYTIDSTKITSTASSQILGFGSRINSSGTPVTLFGSDFAGPAFYDGSTNNQIFFANHTSSNTLTKGNVTSFLGNNSDGWSFQFSIPITQWA